MNEPVRAPQSVCDGWVELLAREPWHWFCTLTFSPTRQITDKYTGERKTVERFHPIRGMHLEAADKAFRFFVHSLNRKLYGNNFRRIPHGGVIWARGQEFHKSGRVHFHSLFAAPDCDLNKATSRYYWHEWWYREFGRNQIESPRDQDDVLGYVSKYVAKDGEVDLSSNFGRVIPPELFSVAQHRRAGSRKVPAPVGEQISTRVGEKGQGNASVLSLTLPVRLLESQTMFTDETFFQTTLGANHACDD